MAVWTKRLEIPTGRVLTYIPWDNMIELNHKCPSVHLAEGLVTCSAAPHLGVDHMLALPACDGTRPRLRLVCMLPAPAVALACIPADPPFPSWKAIGGSMLARPIKHG